jgi:hypothetical protein
MDCQVIEVWLRFQVESLTFLRGNDTFALHHLLMLANEPFSYGG